ncbi:MAG: DUF4890 domain-containing protein [Dysgonamonadaceae bacterium]|jgi:hypothetical protein|nr:DUF4890 domain-containing protein [Dysgonamonadaceae bacterium]
MKKGLFTAALLLCTLVLTNAQNQPRSQRMSVEERAKMITEWMTKELNLTQEQINPVDSINLLFAKAQQVIFQSSDGDREKIRESMDALEKEKEISFAKILTAKQLDLYKKKQAEMIKMRRKQ